MNSELPFSNVSKHQLIRMLNTKKGAVHRLFDEIRSISYRHNTEDNKFGMLASYLNKITTYIIAVEFPKEELYDYPNKSIILVPGTVIKFEVLGRHIEEDEQDYLIYHKDKLLSIGTDEGCRVAIEMFINNVFIHLKLPIELKRMIVSFMIVSFM